MSVQTVTIPAGKWAYLDFFYPPVEQGIVISDWDQGPLVTNSVNGHQWQKINMPAGTVLHYDSQTGNVSYGQSGGSVSSATGTSTTSAGATTTTNTQASSITSALGDFSFTNTDGSINWLLVGGLALVGGMLFFGRR